MVVNNSELSDFYTDYLITSTSYTTATGLSSLLDGKISHDKFTRLLSRGEAFNSKTLWFASKPLVREFETSDGCISIDDSIQEKPYTDESALNCWHWDHTKGRSVKGVNFITAFYYHRGANMPLSTEFILKSKKRQDPKTGKKKRVSDKNKNQLYRELLQTIKTNQVKYQYVLNDIWFSSSANMRFVKTELNKDFVMAIKKNRKVALSKSDKLQGKYVGIGSLGLEPNAVQEVYFKQVEFPVLLIKQVFKNEDGSMGILYLISSDTNLTYDQITAIYQKRWKVEEYHKSLKQHVSLCKSPTKMVRTQSNHIFSSIYAFFRLEHLSIKSKLNPTALRTKLYISANRAAFNELENLKLCFDMKF